MDDPIVSGQNQAQPMQQPVPVAQSVSTPAEPVIAPVGTAHREQEPIVSASSAEIMQPTEVEPRLSPEVKEAGVETVAEVPDLTLSDKNAGLTLAKESVVHPTIPSGVVMLSDEEVMEAVKQKKSGNSIFYLALLILKSAHKKLIGG